MAEVTKKEQTMRYSDEELSLIKNTFCENDYLLKVIRKVFLQGDLSSDEMKVMRGFTMNPESVRILRKTLAPEIELDAPFFQMVDLHVNIDTKEAGMDKAYPQILARDLMCDYLAQQFDVLMDKKSTNPVIKFSTLHRADKKEPMQAFVELMARNVILTHLEFQLLNLKMLAGQKEETVEQTKARLQKNSNK